MSDETEYVDLHAARARWGRGYTIIGSPKTGQWTSAVDGHGNPVPPEDWDAFKAYIDAEFEDRLAAAQYYQGYPGWLSRGGYWRSGHGN